MLELRAMTPASYGVYLTRAVPEYAAGKTQSGDWAACEALAKSEAEYQKLLPQGPNTPNNFLYDLYDPLLGADIGALWYALSGSPEHRYAYGCELYIGAEHRRKGYATQAFELAEADAARRGVTSIRFHVFGHNAGAIKLYERLGYQASNIIMQKTLS